MRVIDNAKVPQVTLPDGRKMPCIGMGTFGSDRFSPEQVSNAVAGAIRGGYRLLDCAACYGNEDMIGQVFETVIGEGVVARKDLFIMTLTSQKYNLAEAINSCPLTCV